MSDLPPPMAAPDCDLRGYDFMPLFGSRLFGSAFNAKALRSPRGGLAAVKLWWAAWQQCPAGSLPSDDDELCHLADFGTDTKGWLKVKALALHGFVKCSDGRLYHPILCKEAKDAFERRRRERKRKAKMRATKAENKDGVVDDVPRDSDETDPGMDAGQDADFHSDRTGQDRTGESKQEPTSLREPPPPRKHGSRLPVNWCPNETECAFAISLGLDPNRVADRFRDFWAAKAGRGGAKLDWTATWRNWCRDDAERRRKPREAEGFFDRKVREDREREAAATAASRAAQASYLRVWQQ